MQMRENEDAYEQFCKEFLPCIVGKTLWDKESALVEISKIASATDEAWGLLLLENSWDLWKAMAVRQESGEATVKLSKEERPVTKWTSSAGAAGRYEGWGEEGIPRYNELVKKARADRIKNGAFDSWYLMRKKSERDGSKQKGRKRQRELEEVVVVEHDIAFLNRKD